MVNNDNFLLKEIPKFHPLIQRFERLNFWKDIKRKTFEGEWVGGRWCPPELYFHVNLSTIQFLGGGRKAQGIGQPWFRDIEWEKAFIYSEACGFSGFIDDPVYTCLRNVLTETKDEIYRDFCLDNKGEKIEKNYRAIFTSAGELKKYMNAREYFWRTDMSSSFGKAIYLNNAKNVLEMGGRGYGKDLEENTLIHGLSSSYPIKDAKVGDKIYGADGKLTTIVSKEIYDNQLQYEVKFSDGRIIECGGGHLWGVWHRSHAKWKYSVKSLNDIMLNYKYKREGDFRYFIPISAPIEYSEKKLPLDPYYLGLWLGDGNSHNTGITTKDDEIVDYLYSFAKDNELHIKENQNKYKNCPTYNINSTVGEIHKSGNKVLRELQKLSLLRNKHIPEIYLKSSINQRLELLRGLMDSDGYAGPGVAEFTSSYVGIQESFPKLINSLGIRNKISYRIPKCNGIDGKLSMRISMLTSLDIFKLSRKRNVFNIIKGTYATTNTIKSAIVSIIPTSVKPSVCIGVDNDSKLFVAGESYVVTHNSYFTSSCIQHNLLTDGGRDYEEYLNGRKDGKLVSISQTLVGAIEAKYSGDLMNKVKFSLEHLPGAIDLRLNGEDKSFPSPLMPEIGGSWEPGAKNPIHDMLSGSSIIHRTFQDNPLAANGTRPTRCFLEEIGFFSTIQEVLGAVEATQPNRQSNKYLPIYMLGTGGYTTTGTAVWLKQIFNDPESYDCLSFDDEWENRGKIGYFVPSTKGLNDFKEGPNLVSNIPRATKIIEDSREKARKSNNKIKILTTIINQPLTPSEVFMTLDGNFFPVEDLRARLQVLESNPTIFNQSYKYEMTMIDGKVFPKLSDKQVIREFPIKKGINMDAPIEVYELPKKNGNGDIPYGRYLASWDPIDVDGNDDTSQSLQSIFIMDSWTDRLVAEYTSRTYLASEYYEQARRLFIYYNALCNYESNLKGPYAHFLNKNSLHLFCDTPEILSDKSIGGKGGVGNKSKGTRVGGNANGSPIINYGVNEILSWIESPAYDKPEGTRVMDTLQGPQLLRELISYSPQLNCDRISSLILLMIIRADRKRITDVSKTQSIKSKASDPLWSRPFGGNHKNLYGGYAQADLNKLR